MPLTLADGFSIRKGGGAFGASPFYNWGGETQVIVMALLKQVIEVDGVKMLADACCCGGTSGGSGSEGPPGPVFVTTPELTLADKLEIGASADLGMSAMAGLNGAYIERFAIIVADAEPVEVSAEGNAATYAFSVGGKAGDILSISVVAVDNYGNRSAPAYIEAECCTVKFPVYAITFDFVSRSLDNGLTWKATDADVSLDLCDICVLKDGTVIACETYTDSSRNLGFLVSEDAGETWTEQKLPGNTCAPKSMSLAQNGNIIIAGMYGTAWDAGKIPVIWLSEDGGKNFTRVDMTSHVAVFSPWGSVVAADGSIILAGVQRNSSDQFRSVFVRSTDNGKSWTPQIISNYGAGTDFGTFLFAADGSTLYTCNTAIRANMNAPKLKSLDNGATWVSAAPAPAISELFWNLSSGGGVLHGAGVDYYRRSVDGGVTWEKGNFSKPIHIAVGPATYATD